MKKYLLILALALPCFACDKINLDDLTNGALSEAEIIDGLKTALTVGTDTSVTTLNKENGYFNNPLVKIFLPAEAKVIVDNMNTIATYIPGGTTAMNAAVDDLVLKINRSAEDAAVEAKPIFVNAITSMTISDGLQILNGEDTAATHYLRKTTYTGLYDLFQPKISASLSKPIVAGVSAESSYTSVVNTYNTAANAYNAVAVLTSQPTVPVIANNSLSSYTTHMGLQGLFTLVADEEKAIRKDPIARVTDILKKVFGSK